MIDVGVAIGADTVIEPSTFLRGATTIGERCTVGPLTHADRRHARRRGHASCTPTSSSARSRTGATRRPVRLPAARRAAARGLEGRHVRRDQELRHRRGHEGPAPLLHRRRRRRRGHEPRRRDDHRQLRRAAQAPHDDRRERPDQRRHDLRRAGDGRRRAPTPAPARSITDDVPAGRARRSPARARRTSRATRRAGATARTPSRHDRAVHCVASMSVQTHPALATSLPIDYDKRLMLFSGRANPELAAQDRRQARRRSRARHAQDVLQRRGLLPLRGVDPRRRRLHRPADVRQPDDRASTPTTR